MAFKQEEVERLLVDTGRRCCLCGLLHKVQVHHIVAQADGGTDHIDNGIPLCPNCHDEVHGQYAPGRTVPVQRELDNRRFF
jgi:5-methylcytosine-specific restriction endonuclease McrA